MFNPTDNTEFSVASDELKRLTTNIKKDDIGYNVIWRMVEKNEQLKKTKIQVYTSNGYGRRIRDAETGDYYAHIVGSPDEDLYFTVILATGECKSKNNSSTLFYLSPQHYIKHMNQGLDPIVIQKWQEKRDARLVAKQLVKSRQKLQSSIIVN
jgi:hypothetical protein